MHSSILSTKVLLEFIFSQPCIQVLVLLTIVHFDVLSNEYIVI